MKNLKLAILLFVLQMVCYIIPFWLVIWLRSDCSGTFSWQCTSGSSPLAIPLLTFLILPPIVAKFLLGKLGRQFSWKQVIIAHFVAAAILAAVALVADPTNHSSGA